MCRRTTCGSCGKPTFAGCGMHVEQVLGDVPRDARCKCREEKATDKPKPHEPAAGGDKPWWRPW